MRILVLSDIHANLPAFEAVLKDAAPFDMIWCIGDIVGYGPQPNECIELLSRYDHVCVAGNHDWATLGKLDIHDFNLDAQKATLWTQKQLTAPAREYLEQLPTRIVRDAFTLVHGSPREPIWEYILLTSTATTSFAFFQTPYCFVGHTHTPAIFAEPANDGGGPARGMTVQVDEPMALGPQRLIINPGSVGQPRDGDARASYIILDLDEGTICYRRTPYSIAGAQAQMRAHHMPDRLVNRLAHGW
jgi:predicted phosphodiesterase